MPTFFLFRLENLPFKPPFEIRFIEGLEFVLLAEFSVVFIQMLQLFSISTMRQISLLLLHKSLTYPIDAYTVLALLLPHHILKIFRFPTAWSRPPRPIENTWQFTLEFWCAGSYPASPQE